MDAKRTPKFEVVFSLQEPWGTRPAGHAHVSSKECRMRPIAIIGIILIVFGVVALVTGGFTYTKEKDKADLGPIDINVTQKERLVPPELAIVALVGGAVLVSVGWRSNRVP